MTVYTVAEVAEILKTTREHIQREIAAGRLKASNISLGLERPRWRISEAALGRYLIDCQTADKPEEPKARRPKPSTAQVKDYFADVKCG